MTTDWRVWDLLCGGDGDSDESGPGDPACSAITLCYGGRTIVVPVPSNTEVQISSDLMEDFREYQRSAGA